MKSRHTSFEAIGTAWNIQATAPISDDAWASLIAQLRKRIEQFDKDYSRFRADSLVTSMFKKSGTYTLPADGYKLVDFYHQLYESTAGSVTPLIGQTMIEAGYDASYSLRKKMLQQPPKWDNVLSYDEGSITITEPVLLDFGAAGKGYLVDIIGSLLEAADIHTYAINAGGDIRYRSDLNEPIEIGLENPFNTSEAVGIVQLLSGSLCASAGSKRKWADIHHIIDPRTLTSPEDIVATWVIAADTMLADGLATALFFTEPRKLLQQFSFSYAIMHKDMSLEYAKDFPVNIFEAA